MTLELRIMTDQAAPYHPVIKPRSQLMAAARCYTRETLG
jgi:hypothetical protein